MNSQLVIGLGEVGRALCEVLDVPGRDIDEGSGASGDILHVAIPWTDSFTEIVRGYERSYEASLVVVHSTVPVGTCDSQGWVHSPVRGRHPALAESLRVFPKWFGAEDTEKRRRAASLWLWETREADTAADTEAAKLWELAQFGLQVRVTQAVYEWCEARGVDPSVVYSQFADGYNQGYQKLGDDRFTRPILDHVPGPIGGHCVVSNMAHLDHEIARIVEAGW